MKILVPTLLTLMNLALGFAAIIICHPVYSPMLIIAGMIFDISDGLVARALKVSSSFGKDLDSLADVVSFGVAPAFLYYKFILPQDIFSIFVVTLIPVFSAVRLAIFNNDKSQSETFKGLPTPANAMFFISFPLILHTAENTYMSYIFSNNVLLYLLPVVFSYILVSPIRMYSFKGLKNGLKANIFPLSLILLVAVSLTILQWEAIPICVLYYIVSSAVKTILKA